MIDAVIPVWKPIDWTSFDVVKKIRGQIKPAKVGHAGTLDPFAAVSYTHLRAHET